MSTNRDPGLCAYCGCPLTDELDVNHSRVHDEETDTDCCCPACAEGIRRFMAGERAQTVEDARRAILENDRWEESPYNPNNMADKVAETASANERGALMEPAMDYRETYRILHSEGYDAGDIDAAIDSLVQSGITYADEEELLLTAAEIDVIRDKLKSLPDMDW